MRLAAFVPELRSRPLSFEFQDFLGVLAAEELDPSLCKAKAKHRGARKEQLCEEVRSIVQNLKPRRVSLLG
jgi:hypothetical protein